VNGKLCRLDRCYCTHGVAMVVGLTAAYALSYVVIAGRVSAETLTRQEGHGCVLQQSEIASECRQERLVAV
jgi:hypothetical protein